MDIAGEFFGVTDWADYDEAFIALHPFYLIDGVRPSDFAAPTKHVVLNDVSELPDPETLLAQLKAGEPGKFDVATLENLAKTAAIQVRWSEVSARLELPDYRNLNTILRTQIWGIAREAMDQQGADALTAYLIESGMFAPVEGRFQPIMEAGIGTAFGRAGEDVVVVRDEFGDYEVQLPSLSLVTEGPLSSRSQILNTERVDGLPAWFFPREISAPDGGLRCFAHWDSFFTVFLGKSGRLAHCDLPSLFEGFWCLPSTTIDWQAEPLIPLAKPTGARLL